MTSRRHEQHADADKSTNTVLDIGSVAARAAQDLERMLVADLAPGLYLVATPIGNLGDITLRAISVLARADIVYCEDTRHSGVLLQHFSVKTRTRPYHDHNADEQRPRVLADLDAGKRVALISDAGMPLVSDPGFKLVRDAAAAGHAITAIPGASATLTAIAASGLPTDAFHFAGFLPPKPAARRARILELGAIPSTIILFEAPQRVADALRDLFDELGPRPAAIARELTKLHEEIVRADLGQLADRFSGHEVKGEVVILVGPPPPRTIGDEAITAALETALISLTLRDAARAVADEFDVPKARVYDIGLKLKRGLEQ